VVDTMREGSDKMKLASALNMSANTYIVNGSAKDAVRAAREALVVVREAKNKEAEVPVLQTLMSASFLKKDPEEACEAAKEISKIYKGLGNKKGEASAMGAAAAAALAFGDGGLALKIAEDAVTLSKGAGDKQAQLSAMSVIYSADMLIGKDVTSMAKEVLALARGMGSKKAEASALMMVGDAAPATKESLTAAKEAVAAFKALGDNVATASASVSYALTLLSQESAQTDEGLQAAKDALAMFKEADCASGEAAALSTTSLAFAGKSDPIEAEKAARESLSVFRDLEDSVGEAYAMVILEKAKKAGSAPTGARLLFGDKGCAHVEVGEKATMESLDAAIDAMSARPDLKVIVLHLEGSPGPSALQSYAKAIGFFIAGLRSLAKPVICSCWGRIAGPSWGLIMCSDYRIAATNTTFTVPLWGPPETFGDLIGHNNATLLCMENGPKDTLEMMNRGVVHELAKGKDAARKLASEMAKRISDSSYMPVRSSINLMSPAAEKWASCVAKGNLKWTGV